jgi:ADP-ribose pyrophosphatase YjhB (NUDIX family)
MADRLAMTDGWRVSLEPVITPVFRFWWRLARPMTLGVRGLARDGEGRVLLIRHTYHKGWHLPGGGVEHGESAAHAATREMAEEGGVEATLPPVLIGFYSNHANHANDHVAFYRFDAWRPCTPLQNGEIAERRFFALGELPAGITPGTRRRIAEAMEGASASATW